MQACKTQGSTVCGQPNLKRQKQKKKKKKEKKKKKKKVKASQISQSDAHNSKERETY